jgi:hypothetical protein
MPFHFSRSHVMIRAALVLVSGCLVFFMSPIVRADDSRTEALRRQIESLRRQLDSGQAEQKDTKVTRIGTPRARQREVALVLRIYDLSDLFAIAPSYHAEYPREFGQQARLVFPIAGDDERLGAAGGMGGRAVGGMGGGGGFGGGGFGGGTFQVSDKSTAPDSKVTLRDLITAIKEVVQPDAWKDNEGQATITALGNALLISADEDVHLQVRDLLNLFRQRWGTLRTVSVQAWWLWLDDAQLHALLADGNATPAGGPKAFGLVSESAWNNLMKELHAAPADPRRLGYRATVTCYNGQVVHVMSDGQRLAVTDVRPVVVPAEGGPGGASVALQPEMSVVNEGAVLQVRPIANISGKTVVLDIHSRVNVRHDVQPADQHQTKPSDPAQRTAAGTQIVVPVVDRNLQLLTNRLSTTLRVPIDRQMLVGGMTFEEQPVPGERSLYLFVRCTVQELRNDQDDAPSGAAPKTVGQNAPSSGRKAGGL